MFWCYPVCLVSFTFFGLKEAKSTSLTRDMPFRFLRPRCFCPLLVFYLHDCLDLHRNVQGEGVGADGTPGMHAFVAEDLDKKVAGTVHDHRLLTETIDTIDEAYQLDNALDLRERSQSKQTQTSKKSDEAIVERRSRKGRPHLPCPSPPIPTSGWPGG